MAAIFCADFFFKIGVALWTSISKKMELELDNWCVAHVRHRPSLGQTQKKQKLQQLQPYSIQLFINSSSPHVHKGGLAKHQNDKPLQTKHRKWTNKHKTTKSNIQTHLKQWTHIFVNLFLMPHIWLNLLDSPGVSFFLIFVFFWFRVKFIFV